MRNRVRCMTVFLFALTAWSSHAQDFDLVISNGRVTDPETLYDGIADVGVTDGRIVQVSKEPLSGTEEIDATGHVVAPGFIDTHLRL